MDNEFKFNANEYAQLLHITPSALRKRRLAGKLDGQFKKVNQNYFYKYHAKDGPNMKSGTFPVSRPKHRRRNVPRSMVQYHKAHNGHQLQLANDLKQMARIQRSLTEHQIAEITPDIIEVAKERRAKRLREHQQQLKQNINTTNYGGFISCNNRGYTDIKTNWKPLFEQPETPEYKQEKKYYL